MILMFSLLTMTYRFLDTQLQFTQSRVHIRLVITELATRATHGDDKALLPDENGIWTIGAKS